MLKKSGITVAVMIASAIVATLSTSPATASTSAPAVVSTDPGNVKVAMTFTGFNPTRAAANGYDIRTTQAGLQYAVRTGTKQGDMTGVQAFFDPTGKTHGVGPAGPYSEVTDNCGDSYFNFIDRGSFETGYDLNPSWGVAVSHSWHVALTSSIDAASYNLSGLPPTPGVSTSWRATRDINQQALPGKYLSGLAGGTVETVLGSCTSTGPTDQVLF